MQKFLKLDELNWLLKHINDKIDNISLYYLSDILIKSSKIFILNLIKLLN